MKYVLITLLLSLSVHAKTIVENDVEYSCNPKPKCEDTLKKLKAENASLRKQLAEKKETVVVKYVEVEKEVYRKHLVSVKTASQTSIDQPSPTTARAETRTVPELTYQYQTDSGFVPLVGASAG